MPRRWEEEDFSRVDRAGRDPASPELASARVADLPPTNPAAEVVFGDGPQRVVPFNDVAPRRVRGGCGSWYLRRLGHHGA